MRKSRRHKIKYWLRIFLFLLIALIVVLAAIPFIDGYLYKQQYLRVMTGIADKYSNKNTKFVIEYKMGWLHSHANIRIFSTAPGVASTLSDSFTISDEITHGPYVYDAAANQYTFAAANIISRVYLPHNLQRIAMSTQLDKPVVEVNILAHFDNTWISRIKVTTLTMPSMGTLQISDSIVTLKFLIQNNELSQYNIKTNIGAVTFRSSNPEFPSVEIQPSQNTYSAARNTADSWNSSSTQSFPNFTLTWEDASKLVINNINATTQDDVDAKNLYQLSSMLNIKSINSPFFFISDFSDIKGTFALKDINYAGFEAYNKTAMDPVAVIASAGKIFTPTSSINFGLSFNSNQGALTSLKFVVKPPADFSDIQLYNLASKLQLTSDIKISEMLLKQIVIKYLEKQDSYSAQLMPGSTPPTEQTPNDPARDMVGNLYRAGKITLKQSLDLFGVISAKPDAATFSQKVTQISPENAPQLTQAYQATLASNAQVNATKPGPATRELRAQTMMTGWEQQGYLIRDGADYTISITTSDAGIMINGKPLTAAPPT